jgi:hypothetical protein
MLFVINFYKVTDEGHGNTNYCRTPSMSKTSNQYSKLDHSKNATLQYN